MKTIEPRSRKNCDGNAITTVEKIEELKRAVDK